MPALRPQPSVALAIALALAAPARTPADSLHVDLPVDLSITIGSAVASGVLASHSVESALLPPTCRWCTPGAFDTWARRTFLWSDPSLAATWSDALQAAVPVGVLAALTVPSLVEHAPARAGEDALLVAQAYVITLLGTEIAKVSAARLRPDAFYSSPPGNTVDARVSFWSGHTSSTFAAATAAGTVALVRGYESGPWILGLGLAGAATTGYLRMAADAHWATDVLAGAAFGAAVGVAVPLLHRVSDGRVQLVPAPGGVALLGRWR
ncbi:MAG TPA: phosphatase PAP2 family protein [Anaeromyxobacter sp.]|nr:phosphatase PAP2 family protein [Anaeromyxobacter sp.]